MRKNLRSIRRMLLLFLLIVCLLVTTLLIPRLLGRSAMGRRKLAARIMQWHLKAMVAACGLHIEVQGMKPEPGESFLLLSNHCSYWDILALGSLLPVSFVAKDSIARWPILGTVISLCNTLFVNRSDVHQRWLTLRRLQRRVKDIPYCVFPEATTTAFVRPKLMHWHRGNIAVMHDPGIPVWLAGLHYKDHGQMAWIDDDALLPHLYRAMQLPRIELHIRLQPLAASPQQALRELAHAAWSQTAKLCQEAQESCHIRPLQPHSPRSPRICDPVLR